MKSSQSPEKSSPQEGIDYYIENGCFVFTEHYHTKRGYCCKSGCRHCPYGFEKNNISEKEPSTKKDK